MSRPRYWLERITESGINQDSSAVAIVAIGRDGKETELAMLAETAADLIVMLQSLVAQTRAPVPVTADGIVPTRSIEFLEDPKARGDRIIRVTTVSGEARYIRLNRAMVADVVAHLAKY